MWEQVRYILERNWKKKRLQRKPSAWFSHITKWEAFQKEDFHCLENPVLIFKKLNKSVEIHRVSPASPRDSRSRPVSSAVKPTQVCNMYVNIVVLNNDRCSSRRVTWPDFSTGLYLTSITQEFPHNPTSLYDRSWRAIISRNVLQHFKFSRVVGRFHLWYEFIQRRNAVRHAVADDSLIFRPFFFFFLNERKRCDGGYSASKFRK